jgi:(E)-4-hydroxy-3-methylbut-2-enyl-diphosphate synthase
MSIEWGDLYCYNIFMKREIFIGNVGIGGNHHISIQSMTSTKTEDVQSTLNQIIDLQEEGCEIIRVAITDRSSLNPFKQIAKESPIPVIADIQFDSYLALKSIENGANGIRINPGNIGSKEKLKEILKLANQRKVPIRIGVNSGSIETKYKDHISSKSEAMVGSVMDKVKFFEDNDFFNIKISLKSSNVEETVQAYRIIDKKCAYPLHLGVTETGTFFSGAIKSAIGIGSLLLDGIGNTIRVSLTEDPIKEIRTTVNLISIVKEVEKKLNKIKLNKKIKVAIMGCEVNGPGEAKEADIGIAFSKKKGYIFKKGEMIEIINPDKAINRLVELIKKL